MVNCIADMGARLWRRVGVQSSSLPLLLGRAYSIAVLSPCTGGNITEIILAPLANGIVSWKVDSSH